MAESFPELMEEMDCSDLGSTDLGSPEQNKQKIFMPRQIIMKLQDTKDRKNLKSDQKEMIVAQETLLNVMWQPGWEGCLGEKETGAGKVLLFKPRQCHISFNGCCLSHEGDGRRPHSRWCVCVCV